MKATFKTYELARKGYQAILDIVYGVANFRTDLTIEQVVELVARIIEQEFDKELVEEYVFGCINNVEFWKAIREKYVED